MILLVSLQNYVTCALGIHFVGYVMMCFGATNSLCSFLFGRLARYTGRAALFFFGKTERLNNTCMRKLIRMNCWRLICASVRFQLHWPTSPASSLCCSGGRILTSCGSSSYFRLCGVWQTLSGKLRPMVRNSQLNNPHVHTWGCHGRILTTIGQIAMKEDDS